MTSFQKDYLEIIDLTKTFLQQNLSLQDTITFAEKKAYKRKSTPSIQHAKKPIKKATLPIIILFSNESKEEQIFLKNLSQAIDKNFGKSHLISTLTIEKKNKWDDFIASQPKLIITTNQILKITPALQKNLLKENQNKLFIKKTPLMLLPEISIFLKTPVLKATLWKNLQLMLNKRNG